ncbi:MAG: cysteine desulfurase [Clostridia bacterium]|nr:cysteine desulfurase [Clostridia bacterium]
MEKLIYLDNAATTPCYEEVAELIKNESVEGYFNPSALYKPSVDNAVKLKGARDTIKSALHAPDGELYFTSGGSEADNTALFCTRKPKNSRIIVGLGEHDAIINSANELKKQGYDVVFAPINTDGSINLAEFKALLDENVSLVSIMHVSNETGAVNDIEKLVSLTRKLAPNAVFHSDGVQAFEKIKVNLRALDVDLYTISAHKIHGPKGVGALFVKKGVSIKPLIYGGGQEKGFRAGTENLPAILGFERAVEINENNFDKNYSKKLDFKEYLVAKLRAEINDVDVISPAENCSPNILTVAFPNVRGEVLLHAIEEDGILVGIGSACSSHHESRFKSLLGLDEIHRDGIIRFSTSEFSDINDVDFVVKSIKSHLQVLQNYKRV